MRSVRVVGALLGLAASLSVVLPAQRSRSASKSAALEWLAPEAAKPEMFTLVVIDDETREPVDRPLVCPAEGQSWILGNPDGRVIVGGDPGDTLHWRVLGPLHEERTIEVAWAEAKGRAARIALSRRVGKPTNPSCD